MTLRQPLAIFAENGGQMCKLRHRPTQRLVKCHLLWRVREVVVATNHVRDLHQLVVHDDHVVVNRHACGAHDDGIAHHLVRKLDWAVDDVVEPNGMLGNTQSNCSTLAIRSAALAFSGIESAAFARIDRRLLVCERMRALPLQFFLRAETEICFALTQQPLGMFAIEIATIALTIRRVRSADKGTFIPIEAEPLQVFQKLSFEALFAALDVGVLDAQDHDAALLPCEQPVEKRGAGVANVQLSRGRRSEANANLGNSAHSMMLARVEWGTTDLRRVTRISLENPEAPHPIAGSSFTENSRRLVLGCACYKSLLRVQSVLFLEIRIAWVFSVSVHVAGFGLIFEVGTQHLITDHADKIFVLHRKIHLDSSIQVARHEVRAAKVNFFLSTVAEIEYPAVLQEAAKNAGDANVLASSGKVGPQAADAAHQQVNFDAGLRRLVEQLDHFLVHQCVHLQDQVTAASVLLVFDFALDQLLEALAQGHRRYQQLAV